MRRLLTPALLLLAAIGFLAITAMQADCACPDASTALNAAQATFHLAVFF